MRGFLEIILLPPEWCSTAHLVIDYDIFFFQGLENFDLVPHNKNILAIHYKIFSEAK